MAHPRVPGDGDRFLELPCGERVDPREFDLGMREYVCSNGHRHAVVMDVHPPSRFFPESFVSILQEMIEPADEFEEFGTPHLMGIALEEFPDEVTVYDAGEDGTVGYAMVWVSAFDSRRLHEVIVELVVELMEHAVSHADDDDAVSEFERQMIEFDVGEFVDEYRSVRDFESEHDRPV